MMRSHAYIMPTWIMVSYRLPRINIVEWLYIHLEKKKKNSLSILFTGYMDTLIFHLIFGYTIRPMIYARCPYDFLRACTATWKQK